MRTWLAMAASSSGVEMTGVDDDNRELRVQEFRLDRNGFRMAAILALLDIAVLRRGA